MPATVFAGTCPEQRPGTRAPAQCLQQECSVAGDSSPAALNLGQYTAVVNCIELDNITQASGVPTSRKIFLDNAFSEVAMPEAGS